MSEVDYTGVPDPTGEFNRLRWAYSTLRTMQAKCRPFGGDYMALAIAMEGVRDAAVHFTGNPYVYGGRPHS